MEIRKAIPVHHTAVSDKSWDGPKNEANLRLDEDPSYYRKAYAWVDPDKDPKTKAAYKFIHHEVSSDGTIGPANIRGCITGIAVLNGARGGTKIPEADKKGVWNHIAAHLRDADVEPPELKSRNIEIDYRSFPFEIRTDEENKIVGYAAVFNQLSVDLGAFREKIAPGAFKKTIQEADIRALWNHDPNFVLGRTKSRTLRLQEDEKGLAIEIIPPNTTWARDLMESIKRGDIDQMSFGFRAIKEDWETEGEQLIRVLKEVELFDVSPVTFPAYPTTDVQVRKLIDVLRCYFPDEPILADHSDERKDTDEISFYKRKLELIRRV